jgi:hypothetical protein
VDLRLYANALWRFRIIVGVGAAAAIVLAFLSYARVDLRDGRPVITYRQAQTWSSSATLLITQKGFPEGRAVFPASGATGVSNFASSNRFTELAVFYARLANSGAVQASIARIAGVAGVVTASPVVENVAGSGEGLPMVSVTSAATSARDAVRLAEAGVVGFRSYLASQQGSAEIPADQRVLVRVLNDPRGAAVIAPRKKTTPIVVFIAVLAATIALALVLENLRPRVRIVEEQQQQNESSRAPRRASI